MLHIHWQSQVPRAVLAVGVLVLIALAAPPAVAPPITVVTPHAASLPLPRPIPSAVPATSAPCSWLAVVIDNSIPAWPQSGVSAASIVYELPAEGGITRLLAFFCEGAPEVVGPVRSLRTYILDLAREYGATVAHAGESASALAMISKGIDPVINEFWQPQPFWRDPQRRMPHNLYTSVPALRRYIRDSHGGGGLHWATAEIPPAPESITILIPYGSGYDVRFDYDPDSNVYRRFIGDHLAIDVGTDTSITVASVIVQYVRWWQTYEGPILESRLDLMGSGPIAVFTAGHRLEGQWHRADARQPTVFTDLREHPLTLAPGPTWVAIVPLDHPVQVLPTRLRWRAE